MVRVAWGRGSFNHTFIFIHLNIRLYRKLFLEVNQYVYFIAEFHKWLKFHKLHKYLYFFGNLSYAEIANINADNIRFYEKKVDLFPMTNGARNAIVRKLGELRERSSHLKNFSMVSYTSVLLIRSLSKLIKFFKL